MKGPDFNLLVPFLSYFLSLALCVLIHSGLLLFLIHIKVTVLWTSFLPRPPHSPPGTLTLRSVHTADGSRVCGGHPPRWLRPTAGLPATTYSAPVQVALLVSGGVLCGNLSGLHVRGEVAGCWLCVLSLGLGPALRPSRVAREPRHSRSTQGSLCPTSLPVLVVTVIPFILFLF